jgi:aspartyl-tRNA synthetase
MNDPGWLQRTRTCGELRAADEGKQAVLNGWVESIRDHGGLRFIDLRDRYGITQVVLSPESSYREELEKVRAEYVVAVSGSVRRRPRGMENPKLETGEIELVAERLSILNPSRPVPFALSDSSREAEPNEEVRLQYRYLDLRRRKVQKNLIVRHRVNQTIRRFLSEEGFLEIETPFLGKSTPEGARDYLVPARNAPGCFFALPQSPQLYKQLCMIAGFDRYFQIVRCMRDEDLRADRQPEFTQLDLEMSFVNESDVRGVIDRLIALLAREVTGREVRLPIPSMTYDEAMARYGSDRPDTRFDLHLIDLTQAAAGIDFQVFRSAVEAGGKVRGIRVEGGARLSRKEIDECEGLVRRFGARGLAWLKLEAEGPKGSFAKFVNAASAAALSSASGARQGDLLLLVADRDRVAFQALGELRLELGRKLGLIPAERMDYLWVTDFPLFEWSEEDKRWNACHHPFTAPRIAEEGLLGSDPGRVKARAYDIVLNGIEIGGGSIRIHRSEVQSALFQTLGIGPEDARQKFGFLLDALSYGAPPHGGIALGLDRWIMLLLGAESIREVMAFPKTSRGTDLMTGAPGPVSPAQLAELGVKIVPPPPKPEGRQP